MRNVALDCPGGGVVPRDPRHARAGRLIAASSRCRSGCWSRVYLVEYGRGRLAQGVTLLRRRHDRHPSIVAGLFILSFWILGAEFQASGLRRLAGLTILMLPIVVRSTEEMLKLVPTTLREAVVRARRAEVADHHAGSCCPTALPGIVTGIMLGVARVIGETAPVLLAGRRHEFINTNLFSGPRARCRCSSSTSTRSTATAGRAGTGRWAAALTLILSSWCST